MTKETNSYSNWRTKSSYISTCISIAMVIFMLGLMGFFLMRGKEISDKSKENFRYEVYIKDGAKEIEIMQFKKMLDAEDYVIKTIYKDQNEALEEYKAIIDPNENFLLTLGENPLPQNIDVQFKAEYAHPDSLLKFEKIIKNHPLVSDFRYPKDLLYLVHQNLHKITLALLGVSALLLIVAIALINNTIRLRVYNQRFVLRTMQLIGATNSFIRTPFIWNAFLMGLFSGIIAVLGIVGSVNLLYDYWPELTSLMNPTNDLVLYVSMILASILISVISTWFAVARFLRLKTEKLYF